MKLTASRWQSKIVSLCIHMPIKAPFPQVDSLVWEISLRAYVDKSGILSVIGGNGRGTAGSVASEKKPSLKDVIQMR